MSTNEINFVNMKIDGDIPARYRFKKAIIKITLLKLLKGNPNQFLAMVSFPKDEVEKREEPVRTDFFEYTLKNPVARDVTKKFIASLLPMAVKEFQKQATLPSNKWVAHTPIVIKKDSSVVSP